MSVVEMRCIERVVEMTTHYHSGDLAVKTPGILNSKIRKIRIELPHYSFSQTSSSDESQRGFVGRKNLLKKLKELVRDAGDTIGVYLVTGARGVGKSNMIEEVIRGTSLRSDIADGLKHILVLFCVVAGAQLCFADCRIKPFVEFVAHFFSPDYQSPEGCMGCSTALFCIFSGLWLISFAMLCYFNEYRRAKNGAASLFQGVLKELCDLGCAFGSYRKTRYLLKIIFIVSFSVALSAFIAKVNDIFHVPNPMKPTATATFLLCLGFVLVWNFFAWVCWVFRLLRKRRADKYDPEAADTFWGYVKENVFRKIGDAIEGHNRVYLRINFGNRLKDEKDILRLIARTLLTEYRKYHRSFWKSPVWRVVSIVFLFAFAGLFSGIVGKLQIYGSIKGHIANGNSVTYVKETKGPEESVGFGAAKKFILAADTVVLKASRKVERLPRHLLVQKSKQDEQGDREGGINHPFWLSFFFLYLLFAAVFRSRRLSRYFVTHRMILNKLKDLNDDITYSTEREKSANIQGGTDVNAKVGTKIKRSRGVADAREIERELQNIFQDVQRIPILMGRPKFVIVFDELDKVEPGDVGSENARPETKAALFSIHAARERQSEILKILSNMKYFLSTSEAKFIFIAGREMYDIYLADVSDRNNYIGSIFSAVIEVPSFLTDHGEKANKADMTSLTEEFVCRRLFPNEYPVKGGVYNLENYRKYLENEIYGKRSNKNVDKAENPEIQKIIAVLQQFVIYLAHVSKGAPKKMMQLFVSFIEVHEVYRGKKKKENRGNEDITARYYRRSKLFLAFDRHYQHTLGLIAYLITPIFYRLVEGNISSHNDKLLVSSLRFVDFVFKFHKHSFSWRHVDISPEMLEVNRAPELRPITVDLLNYMAQIHVTKSNFSLFDYRFDNLIANEIFAATKTNEVASALFCFSLDETLPLRKQYEDLLAKTRKEYQNDRHSSSAVFIDAVSSLQIVLGDLHYFDDELEEAGIYYRDAIEVLRRLGSKSNDDNDKWHSYHIDGGNGKDGKNCGNGKDGKNCGNGKDGKNCGNGKDGENIRDRGYREDLETMNPEQLYLFVRNMLKVGMIYETRKQHEQAYLIYGEVCRLVVRERDIAIRELGAGIAVRKNRTTGKNEFIKTSTVNNADRKEEMYNDNVEYQETYGWKLVDEKTARLQPLYFQRISPNTNDMLFRKMTYEGLKLLYLPFLVKLQILEKSHMGGITRTHLEQLEKEFEHLTFIIDHEEASILEADFFSRVGDILYYKNADLKSKRGKDGGRLKDEDNDKYIEKSKSIFENEEDTSIPKNKESKSENYSCTTCYYYHKALSKLFYKDELNDKKKDRENTTIEKLLTECVNKLDDKYRNMKFCTVLARILSDWGNVFLSCDKIRKKEKCDTNEYLSCDGEGKAEGCYIRDERIDDSDCSVTVTKLMKYGINCATFESTQNTAKQSLDFVVNDVLKSKLSKLEIAFAMYSISSVAFRKADNNNRAAYQIYKMLRLFKRYKIEDKDNNVDKLSQKAISLLWHAADELNALERNKQAKDFGRKKDIEKMPLRYLLVDSEIAIIVILVKELKLELELKNEESVEKRVAVLKELYKLNVASPDGINYSISARIFQLRLKADINYEAYKLLLAKDTLNIFDGDDSKERLKKEMKPILSDGGNQSVKNIFNGDGCAYDTKSIFIGLVSESIFCLKEIIRLAKTLNESYRFGHSFMGKIHDRLSFWIMRYEAYKEQREKDGGMELMRESLQYFLDYLWEEQLSSHYERQQALSHYHKCFQTHTEGKAYFAMIDNLFYVKDDYNDRSDHFCIAVERHKILNGDVQRWINETESEKERTGTKPLYNADNYFGRPDDKGD